MNGILLDQGFAPRVARLLRQNAIDAIHASEIEIADRSDAGILERARTENRILVTLDHDFHASLATTVGGRPPVVLLEPQRLDADGQAEVIQSLWLQWESASQEGLAIPADAESTQARKAPGVPPASEPRQSEFHILAMFQQAPSFICILRGPDHVFEFTNDAYRRLVGETRELLGKPVRHAVPEAQGQGYFELLDQVYRSGQPFTGAETPLRLRRTADGPLLDMLVDFIYQPILDASGLTNGIFVEGFEVTERVAAQAALRQSETRYRTLFNSIDEGFCIVEAIPESGGSARDYRYIAVNPVVEAQSGIPAKVGDTLRGLLGIEAESWIDVFDQILRTGAPLRGERGLLAQGRVLDLYSFRLEDDSNRRIGVLFTDITARKRAEAELLRANQALEQFAYSASHDLQEPLRSIKIYSELLSQRFGDRLTGDGDRFLQFLTAGAVRMELLVRDLLSFTQAPLFEVPAEPVEAGKALARALANLAQAAQECSAKISYGSMPAVRVHETQLQQIFQNLVDNAIKYRRPETPPVVAVEARRDREMWLFSVSDNGIGIEPEYKDRVFGLFKRLHAGDAYSGTGIGLAICQRIVGRYQGRIWVESQPGKGSKFCFTLPS
jgi:signal transduction histidine kinase/predicted nuclease of predicted toxin-antitoxin system